MLVSRIFKNLNVIFVFFPTHFRQLLIKALINFSLNYISNDIKKAFDKKDFVTFYKNYVWEKYANLA